MKGILFKPDSIKAIIEGRKTMTRRVIKPQPPTDAIEVFSWFAPEIKEGKAPEGLWMEDDNGLKFLQKSRCRIGEVVYIKEAIEILEGYTDWFAFYADKSSQIVYPPEEFISNHILSGFGKYTARTIPAWASRYHIRITDVRAERLAKISLEDAEKEGVSVFDSKRQNGDLFEFIKLWDSINGKSHPWESNPWVWVIEFNKIQTNIKVGK